MKPSEIQDTLYQMAKGKVSDIAREEGITPRRLRYGLQTGNRELMLKVALSIKEERMNQYRKAQSDLYDIKEIINKL